MTTQQKTNNTQTVFVHFGSRLKCSVSQCTWFAGLHHIHAHLPSWFGRQHRIISLMGHVKVPVGVARGGACGRWEAWQVGFTSRCAFQSKSVPCVTHLLTHQLSDQQTSNLVNTQTSFLVCLNLYACIGASSFYRVDVSLTPLQISHLWRTRTVRFVLSLPAARSEPLVSILNESGPTNRTGTPTGPAPYPDSTTANLRRFLFLLHNFIINYT